MFTKRSFEIINDLFEFKQPTSHNILIIRFETAINFVHEKLQKMCLLVNVFCSFRTQKPIFNTT